MMVPHTLALALLVLITSGYVASDTFTSTNYPGLYPHGSKLAKSFSFGYGFRCRVVLKTLSLAGTDSVTIVDGAAAGTACYGKALKRYTATGVNQAKDTVFSVGLEVCILFDGTQGNGKGFEFFIEGIPTCGGKYQDVEESDIISPRYPGHYPWNNNCKWQVIVPAGQHISFKVYAFDLESGCSKAYITISNIEGYSSTKKFCYKEIANKVIGSLGSSDVYFWSRDWDWWGIFQPKYPGYGGFRLQFTVLGCKQDDLPTTAEYGTQTNPQPLYNERYVAKFHCDDGYKYSNGLEELALTCESDKKWHQVAEAPWPTCVQIKCPRPGGPKYGSVKYDSEVIGTKAIYTCDANFNLVGESVRVCQNDGTWNGKEPVCQFVGSKGCQEIGDPAFGHIIGNGSSTNSVLAFECNKGYTLNGPANITCQADGTWSGRIPTCDVVRCPVLTAPSNGNVQSDNPVYQTVVTYTCSSGYRLVNSTDGKRECLETGLWSGPEPSCEVITCPIPTIYGGNVTYDTLMIGGQVNITCDKGREMMGNTTGFCLPTGEWSVLITICLRVRCPPLVNLTNADAEWTDNFYGNEVTVECRPGFFLDEERSVNKVETRCTEIKEWSGNASQGCLFAPVPTTPPVPPVITTPTVVIPTGTPTPTGLPQTTKTTPIKKLPTTTTPPTTSLESTSTSAAVKEVTTSQPATDDLVTTSATNTTAQPSSTDKVFTVTNGRLTPTETAATTARSTTAGTAETAATTATTATTEKSDEISTAEVSPTRNFTAKEPSTTAAIQSSTAAVIEISTVNAGNSSMNPAVGNGTIAKQTGGGRDKSGEHIGIGVGCALLVIVLVVVAVWYFRKSNAVPSERLANVDENSQGAFENQLYDLDSVNVTLGDNERAIDVHQASFNN